MQEKQFITQGIILHKIDYSDTSLILEVFTEKYGKISVIVKGGKREKRADSGFYQIMNQLEFSLISQQSDMYLVHDSTYVEVLAKLDHWEIFKYQCAALELYRNLIISNEESHDFFEVLRNFLSYIRSVDRHHVLIFWRFLLRIFKMLGIELNVAVCAHCLSEQKPLTHYNSQQSGFLCADCTYELNEPCIPLESHTAFVLRSLPTIGHSLSDIDLSEPEIREINSILVRHFEDHLHQKLIFKSLKGFGSRD